MNPIRQRYIEAGFIVPLPTPLTADEMDARGFHQAARARRRRR